MRAVSLFSGCGGMDLGFQQAGFEIVRSLDNDAAAVAVHGANLASEAILADATGIDYDGWSRQLGSIDVVLGGFPCQGFSKAGPKRRNDPRNVLYRAMLRAVDALKPRYFIAENVEGLAQNFGGDALDEIRRDFGSLGYRVDVKLLDASGFGVPQHRRRIIFVGSRLGSDVDGFNWPTPTHRVTVRNGETESPRGLNTPLHGLSLADDTLPDPLTIAGAIGDLRVLDEGVADHVVLTGFPSAYERIIPSINPGQKLCNVRHGPESVRTWEIPEAFGPTTSQERRVLEVIARNRRHKKYGTIPNGNPLPVAVIEELTGFRDLAPMLESLRKRKYVKRKGDGYDLLGGLFCSGLFKRPEWHAPSPTVLTNFGNPRYFLHPIEDRPFSLREAARLQGFPDNFFISGSEISGIDGFRLIGNAVPPPLARAIGDSLMDAFQSVRKESA